MCVRFPLFCHTMVLLCPTCNVAWSRPSVCCGHRIHLLLDAYVQCAWPASDHCRWRTRWLQVCFREKVSRQDAEQLEPKVGHLRFFRVSTLSLCSDELFDACAPKHRRSFVFASRASFVHHHGKYDLVKIDYSADTEALEEKLKAAPAAAAKQVQCPSITFLLCFSSLSLRFLPLSAAFVASTWTTMDVAADVVQAPASALPAQVRSLMELLFDVSAMTTTVVEMNYDVKKLPLGKLTSQQIKCMSSFARDCFLLFFRGSESLLGHCMWAYGGETNRCSFCSFGCWITYFSLQLDTRP